MSSSHLEVQDLLKWYQANYKVISQVLASRHKILSRDGFNDDSTKTVFRALKNILSGPIPETLTNAQYEEYKFVKHGIKEIIVALKRQPVPYAKSSPDATTSYTMDGKPIKDIFVSKSGKLVVTLEDAIQTLLTFVREAGTISSEESSVFLLGSLEDSFARLGSILGSDVCMPFQESPLQPPEILSLPIRLTTSTSTFRIAYCDCVRLLRLIYRDNKLVSFSTVSSTPLSMETDDSDSMITTYREQQQCSLNNKLIIGRLASAVSVLLDHLQGRVGHKKRFRQALLTDCCGEKEKLRR